MKSIKEIEQGVNCCSEFLCGECPYKKYNKTISGQVSLKCIHHLMTDVNKIFVTYFKKEKQE